MKHLMLIGTVAVLLMLLTMNCARKPEPSVTVPLAAPTMSSQQSAASSGKADWEAVWQKTLVAAKKEGELLVYASNVPPEARITVTDAFDKKFGIKMNALIAPSPQLQTRINSEYRAGVYQVDVYIGGVSGIIINTKPLGYLSPLEPVLILPEIREPKMWLAELPQFRIWTRSQVNLFLALQFLNSDALRKV
ncbi:MAG: hypothetical protein HY673_02660 [Chloroflexi bacterium]|nr:hypothetical protein [Chloroflexota bacterium]